MLQAQARDVQGMTALFWATRTGLCVYVCLGRPDASMTVAIITTVIATVKNVNTNKIILQNTKN